MKNSSGSVNPSVASNVLRGSMHSSICSQVSSKTNTRAHTFNTKNVIGGGEVGKDGRLNYRTELGEWIKQE